MDEEKGLEKLLVWAKALDLAVFVCKSVLPAMPDEEKYALSTQLRKSVQSIPANIAEGHGRYHFQDTIRFCYIARGSLEETRSHLILAKKLGYLESDSFHTAENMLAEIRRLLSGYIRFLKKSKRGETETFGSIKEEEISYDLE